MDGTALGVCSHPGMTVVLAELSLTISFSDLSVKLSASSGFTLTPGAPLIAHWLLYCCLRPELCPMLCFILKSVPLGSTLELSFLWTASPLGKSQPLLWVLDGIVASGYVAYFPQHGTSALQVSWGEGDLGPSILAYCDWGRASNSWVGLCGRK